MKVTIKLCLATCAFSLFLTAGPAFAQLETESPSLSMPPLTNLPRSVLSPPSPELTLPNGEGTIELWIRPGKVEVDSEANYECLISQGKTTKIDDRARVVDVFDARYALYLHTYGRSSTLKLQVGDKIWDVHSLANLQGITYVAITFSKSRIDAYVVESALNLSGQKSGDVQTSSTTVLSLAPVENPASESVCVGGIQDGVTGIFYDGRSKRTVEEDVRDYKGGIGRVRVWNKPLPMELFIQNTPITWVYDELMLSRRMEFPYPGVRVAAKRPKLDSLIAHSVATAEGVSMQLADPLVGNWMKESDAGPPRQAPLPYGKATDSIGPVCNIHDATIYSIVKETKFSRRYYVYENGVFIGYLDGSIDSGLTYQAHAGGRQTPVEYDSASTLVFSNDSLGRLKRPDDRGKGIRVTASNEFLLNNKVQDIKASCVGYDLFAMNPKLIKGDTSGRRKAIFVEPHERGGEWYLDETNTSLPLGFHIIKENATTSKWANTASTSRREFLESWGVRVGVQGGFGGEVADRLGATSNFGVSGGYAEESSKNEFAERVEITSRSYARVMTLAVDRMHAQLSDEFVADVNRLTEGNGNLDAFIDKYGTHYPHGVTYGGVLWFSEELDRETVDKMESMRIEAGANLRIGDPHSPTFSVDVEGNYSFTDSEGKEVTEGTVELNAVGGSPVLASDGRNVQLQVDANNGKPVLMDLRPIYELLSPIYFHDPKVYLDVRYQLQNALVARGKKLQEDFYAAKGFRYDSAAKFRPSPPPAAPTEEEETTLGTLHVRLDSVRADFASETYPDFFGYIDIFLGDLEYDEKLGRTADKMLLSKPLTLWEMADFSVHNTPYTWTIKSGEEVYFPCHKAPAGETAQSTTTPESWGKYFNAEDGMHKRFGGGKHGVNVRISNGAPWDFKTYKLKNPEMVAEGHIKLEISDSKGFYVDKAKLRYGDYYHSVDSQWHEFSDRGFKIDTRLFEDDGSDFGGMRCEDIIPQSGQYLSLANCWPETIAAKKKAVEQLQRLGQTEVVELMAELDKLKADISSKRKGPELSEARLFLRRMELLHELIAHPDPRLELLGLLDIWANYDVAKDPEGINAELQQRIPPLLDSLKTYLDTHKIDISRYAQSWLNIHGKGDGLAEKTAGLHTLKLVSFKNPKDTLQLNLRFWWDEDVALEAEPETIPPPFKIEFDTGDILASIGEVTARNYKNSTVVFPIRTQGKLVPTNIAAIDEVSAWPRTVTVFGTGSENCLEYPVQFRDDPTVKLTPEQVKRMAANGQTKAFLVKIGQSVPRPVEEARTYFSHSFPVSDGAAAQKITQHSMALPLEKLGGRLDAMTTTRRGRQFLFSGSQCLEIVPKTSSGRELEPPEVIGPMSIAEKFPGIPKQFEQGIDAAFTHREEISGWFDYTYYIRLYRGKEYVIYNLLDKEFGAVKPLPKSWPADFQSGIDAATSVGQKTFFIKGDRCIVWDANKATEEVKRVVDVFPGAQFVRSLGLAERLAGCEERQLVGDFDGDSADELFVADGTAWRAYDFQKKVWRHLRYEAGTNASFSLADFDGDGLTDVYRHGSKGVVMYASQPEGGSWQPLTTGSGNWRFHDLNGDGKADGVYDHESTEGKSQIYPNLPAGTVSSTLPAKVSDLAFADFDGDGKTDAFRATGKSFEITAGDEGEFKEIATSGNLLSSLKFGDFNGDRKTDIMLVHDSKWHVHYFPPSGRWKPLNTSQYPPSMLTIGDFNGDGKSDVLRVSGDTIYVSFGGTSAWVAFE